MNTSLSACQRERQSSPFSSHIWLSKSLFVGPRVIGWFGQKLKCVGKSEEAVAADILKNIITCSYWRIKMLLQNLRKTLKIFLFPPSVLPRWTPNSSVLGRGERRSPFVMLGCSVCTDSVCASVCKMTNMLYASASVAVRVLLGFIIQQQSRRSPPQPSAVSHKVSHKTRREGCLSG